MRKIDKLTINDHVAVLVTDGYGARWSTCNGDKVEQEQMLFDPVLAQAIVSGADKYAVEALAKQRYPEAYFDGAQHLTIEWVPVGQKFIVRAYDNREAVVYLQDLNFFEA